MKGGNYKQQSQCQSSPCKTDRVWRCTAGGIQSSPVPVCFLFFKSLFPSVPEEWDFSASGERRAEWFENILTYCKWLHFRSVMISKWFYNVVSVYSSQNNMQLLTWSDVRSESTGDSSSVTLIWWTLSSHPAYISSISSCVHAVLQVYTSSSLTHVWHSTWQHQRTWQWQDRLVRRMAVL